MRKRSVVVLLTAPLAVAVVVVAGIALAGVVLAVFVLPQWGPDSSPFVAADWRAERGVRCDSDAAHKRVEMVADLLENRIEPGMSEAAVGDVLGRPDEETRSGRKLWWTYYTGNDRIDCTTLEVVFEGGRVVEAYEGQT